MIGANVVVKEGAFIHRAVVHNRVFVGQGATLRGCVVGKNTDVMRRARIEETAVIGDECVIEPEAYISAGVKVYPFKTIEAGAVVNNSVIWESRGQRTLFGERGVSGLINVEVTPELAVRLASAYATTLQQGLDGHHVARRVPGGAHPQARRAERAERLARSTSWTWRRCRCRSPGSRPRGASTAAASRCAPRRATPSRSTSSSSTSAAPSCPRARSASWSGCSPGRSSAARSPARSPSCPTRPASSSCTRTSCCAASTSNGVHAAGAQGGRGLRGRHRVAGAAHAARQHRRRRAHAQQPARRGHAHPDRGAGPGRDAAARRGRLVVAGDVRRPVRPGRRADPPRRREGRAGQRRAGAARRARPGGRRAAAAAGSRCR